MVGTPVANRRRPEIEELIGFFVNTLVLRVDLAGDPAFGELLGRVREVALGAFAHQDLPFERLVEELLPERDLSCSPLFQVMVVLQNAPPAAAVLGALEIRRPDFEPGVARFDLLLDLTEVDDGLRGALEFNTDLFDRTTVQRLAERLRLLLEAVAASPSLRLSEIPLLPEAERHQLLREWVGAPSPAWHGRQEDVRGSDGREILAHEFVAAQACRTPDAAAVLGLAGEVLTYRNLLDRARALARRLVALGVGAESRVVISLPRSVDLAVAVLGVLEAGAAYVPLDPEYPAERRASMLADSGAALVLTRDTLAQLDLTAGNGGVPRPRADGESLAYVLYTSGSTGRPKGVAMRHAALANLIAWELARSPGPWRTLQFASLSFDVSFQEIFSTWAGGGTLVLIAEEERRDPAALWARLRAARAERLFLPFVALQQLAEAARGEAPLAESLREVVTAGEQLPRHAGRGRAVRAPSKARLHNHYGPSETHVATAFTLGADPASWPSLPPIGRPIAGDRAYVLDRDGRSRCRPASRASFCSAARASPAAISAGPT